MARLGAFTDSDQLSLDDVLAEFRAEAPPESVAAVEKGTSMAPAGADPDVLRSSRTTIGDVSQAKIGTETHFDGDCPNAQQCERERQQRPYYLPSRCHWQAWGDWRRCPKLNGGIT